MRHLYILLIINFFLPAICQAQEEDTVNVNNYRVYRNLSAALQNPDSVYRLDLSKQKLKVIPEDVKKLPNLLELKITRNKLRELPEWIGNFPELRRLDLSYNKLVSVPASIGKLHNLQYLGLNRNLIETLPEETGNLKNLVTLEMWDNELDYLPESMKNLRNLKVFELRGILFSQEEQQQISELLPETEIHFSPSCNCKN